MSKKISIKQAANGFIVKVIDSGESVLKEPYSNEIYVFKSFAELNLWLKEFFK